MAAATRTKLGLRTWTISFKTAEFGWLPMPFFVESDNWIAAITKADTALRENGADDGRYMISSPGCNEEFDYTCEPEADSVDGSAY